MAKVLGVRNRGRKKGELRKQASVLAATVAAQPGPAMTFEVEVAPANGRKRPEIIEVTLPKGTVAIPVALTSDKSEENAREQLRLAAGDAGATVSIRSASYMLDADADDAEPRVAWFYVPAKPKAEKPKAARKSSK